MNKKTTRTTTTAAITMRATIMITLSSTQPFTKTRKMTITEIKTTIF